MGKRIFQLILLFFCLSASQAWGTVDYMAEEKNQQALAEIERLYSQDKFDEVITAARDLMKRTPADHPLRQRALDLITLSMDRRNKRNLQQENEQILAKNKKSAEQLVTEGSAFLAEKKYSDALNRFSRAVNKFGGDAETHFLVGYTNQQLDNQPEAYLAYKTCVQINPEHPRALFHLAELSFKLKRLEEAENYCGRIVKLMTNRIEELKSLGYEQKVAGLNDKALATARKIADIKRNLAQAHYMLGILLERKEKWARAKDSFQASANYNSRPMEVYFHLGNVNFKLGQLHSAQQAFEQSLFIGETIFREEAAKGKKLLDEGKADDAVAAELKVKSLKNKLAIVRYSHAVCAFKRKDFDAANESIDKALKFNPELQQARFARASILAESRDYQTALYEIRKVLKTAQPNSPEALRAINLLKKLMERSSNEVAGLPTPPPPKVASFGTVVNEYVKDMPGLGGRATEAELKDIISTLREVQDLLNKQNIPEAIRSLIHLRIKHPNLAQVHAVLGQCYFEQGRLEDAAESFKKALAIFPRETESLANLAYIYTLKGEKLDKALDMASQAVLLEPNRAEFHHTLGWVQFRLGEIDKAIFEINRALDLKPNYPIARYNLGLACYLGGMFEQALAAFEQVISAEPKNDKALLFKAMTLAKLKRHDDSIKTLDDLKKSLPEKELLSQVVGGLHNRLKLANERHTEAELPAVRHHAPIEKLLKKAREYRDKGLVSRAKELYLECQRLNPNAFAPWLELGNMYAESGLTIPARRAWEQALKINPNSYSLQLNIGKTLFKTGDRAKAKQAFIKAESLNTNDPDPSYYLGLIAYEEKRYESAESYAMQAVRLKPRFYKALALMGMARIRQGRTRQARDAYEIIYAYAPADSSIRRHARKKLWEIARLMAPDKGPSYANAQREAEEMMLKATGSGESFNQGAAKSTGKAYRPKMEGMTTDEKIFVMKKLQAFDNLPEPPMPGEQVFKKEDSQNKQWVQKRMELFKVGKKMYPSPPPMVTSKYTLHDAPKPKRQADPGDELVKSGIAAAERGFLIDAKGFFEKALEASPKNLDALVNLGFIHTLSGNFKDAFDLFLQAVQYHPNHGLPRLALGNLYWLGGKGKEAVEQWSQIKKDLKIDPAFSLIIRSEKAWKRLLDTNPNDVEARSNLGIVYLFSNRQGEAVTEFKHVLIIEPTRLENRFYEAAAHLITYLQNRKTVDKREARECLIGLAAIVPPFPHSGTLLGYVNNL